MLLEVLILAFTCLVNLSLGIFILRRNTRLLSNISFFLLTVSISAWAVSNFLTEADVPLLVNRIFNSLAYLFGFLCVYFIVYFCYNYPRSVQVKRSRLKLFNIV